VVFVIVAILIPVPGAVTLLGAIMVLVQGWGGNESNLTDKRFS